MNVTYAGLILIGAAIGLAGSVWRLGALMILALIPVALFSPGHGFGAAALACIMSAISMQLGYFAAIVLRAYLAEDPPAEVAIAATTSGQAMAERTNIRKSA